MDEKNEDDEKKMEAFKCWLVEEEKKQGHSGKVQA